MAELTDSPQPIPIFALPILPAAAVFLFIARALTGELAFAIAAIGAALSYGAIELARSPRVLSSESAIWISVAAALGLFAALNAEPSQFRAVYYFLAIAAGAVIARHFARHPDEAWTTARIAMFSYLAWFALTAAAKGLDRDALNDFIPDASRNLVSLLALLLQVFYCTACYRVKGALPLVTPALTFGIAILCHGRASLAVAAALLLLCVIHNWLAWMRRAGLGGVARIALFALGFVALLSGPFLAVMFPLGGWGGGLVTMRWDLAMSYIDELDGAAILTGIPLNEPPLIAEYTDNPHNSYIRGHSYFGAGYFVLLAFVLAGIANGIARRQWVLAGLTVLPMIRVFTDTYALPGNFDFVILLPLFAMIRGDNRAVRQQ